MCSNYKWAAIGTLYRGTELRIYLMTPDPVMVKKLEQDVCDFAARVKLFETDKVTDWYPALNPNDGGLTYPVGEDDLPPIELKGLANDAALRLIDAKRAKSSIEKLIESTTAAIMDEMAIHTRALVQENGKVIAELRWPTNKARGEYVVPARPAGRGKSLRVKMVEG